MKNRYDHVRSWARETDPQNGKIRRISKYSARNVVARQNLAATDGLAFGLGFKTRKTISRCALPLVTSKNFHTHNG